MARDMRIGWLQDPVISFRGGAELSGETLIASAPSWVEIVRCTPNHIPVNVDARIVLTCTEYDAAIIPILAQMPVITSTRDQWTIGCDKLRSWLLNNARVTVFNSPPHYWWFMYPVHTPVEYVPPPVDLERFREAARDAGEREGTMWLGAMHRQKGILEAVHWARENKTVVDFYGRGSAIPQSEQYVRYCGWVDYDKVPALMARYKQFLYLPRAPDGFSRATIEAWASGLELIIDKETVGSWWWIKNQPTDLEKGAELFWDVVENYAG